ILGLALAASCGIRAFLPLFAVGVLGATGKIELAESYAWISSPISLICFGTAVCLEVAGDKIPVVDHALDSVAVFVKPVAAAVAAASVMTELDPMVSTVVGLLVGGTMAEGVHLVKAKVRLMSTALTATIANPFISLLEDIVAVITTVLAFLVPVLVSAIGAALIVWLGFRLVKRRSKQDA
ncbi:MAG: DUF4126 domain-containing protein, partial [Myxococcota bacterium]